jgi:DNA repair protein RecO (recombination protein O)
MSDRPRERAICLYVTDFSETSQVAHFLARASGVVHALAKGSKRPKSATGGPLDLLEEGEMVFIPSRREGMATLVEFAPATYHVPLRKRAGALNAALYMAEITHMLLAESDPHPPAFDLLSAALARLDKSDAPIQAVLAYFQWRLLRQVGLLGEMDGCIACGKALSGEPLSREAVSRERFFFSSREGGFLCSTCRPEGGDRQVVPPAALAGIAALAAMDRRQPASLAEPAAAAVNDLLAYHLSYQLGKTPRMLRHIRPARPGPSSI